MSKLHSIIAVEKNKDELLNDAIVIDLKDFANEKEFIGQSKVMTLLEDIPENQHYQKPPQNKALNKKVGNSLKKTLNFFIDAIDLSVSKEKTNLKTSAEVMIGESKFNLSSGEILAILKRIDQLKKYFKKIPTLSTNEFWSKDETDGVYKTQKKEENSTVKAKVPVELTKATDKFQATAQLVDKDIVVGKWGTILFSGELSNSEKMSLISKLSDLETTFKQALQAANDAEVEMIKIGESISNFLLSGIDTTELNIKEINDKIFS